MNNDVAIRWRSLSIKRRIEMDIKETFSWNTVDSRRLRGGPDMRYNSNFETNIALSTDRAKRIMFKLDYNGRHYLDEKNGIQCNPPEYGLSIGESCAVSGAV